MKLKKLKRLKKLSSLKKTAWRLYSIKRRSEVADFAGHVNCFTCNIKLHWKDAHLGHYLHGKLDFDDRNTKIQCVKCNTYLHGNLGQYSKRLIKENGIDWLEQLEKDANTKGNNYTREELNAIIKGLRH